jgi:hypothetical protein
VGAELMARDAEVIWRSSTILEFQAGPWEASLFDSTNREQAARACANPDYHSIPLRQRQQFDEPRNFEARSGLKNWQKAPKEQRRNL